MPKSPTPLVGIVADSEDTFGMLEDTVKTLDELRVPHELQPLSAHHTPDQLREYAESAEERGLRFIIAGENGGSHLAGMMKAFAGPVQVLAVLRMTQELRGLDAIASVLMMPTKVPVAVMGFDKAGAVNAGVFAAGGLAPFHPEIAEALKTFRERYKHDVLESNRRVRDEWMNGGR